MFDEKSKNQTEAETDNEELKNIHERAADMEQALFFARHIDNPCEVQVAPGKRENIRDFYIREAKTAMKKMANDSAKNFLEAKIKEYEK